MACLLQDNPNLMFVRVKLVKVDYFPLGTFYAFLNDFSVSSGQTGLLLLSITSSFVAKLKWIAGNRLRCMDI